MNKKDKKFNNGFTLIELMVATTLFIVIMLSAMSALFMLLGESKNSRALRFAMDNVNFAMDSMTRSIRMGTNYYCVSSGDVMPSLNTIEAGGQNCSGGGPLLAFIPQLKAGEPANSLAGYMRVETTSGSGKYTIQKCTSPNTYDCVPVVSPDVNVDVLKFFVNGTNGNSQPSVYIIMKGTVLVKGVPTSFAVQTMASQRNF